MTYPEYEAAIKQIVANPDTIAEATVTLLENIKSDLTALDSSTAEIAARDDRIRSLQEANYKLFLRVTGDTPDPDDVDEHPFDTAISKIFEKEENNNA